MKMRMKTMVKILTSKRVRETWKEKAMKIT